MQENHSINSMQKTHTWQLLELRNLNNVEEP